jgi:ketosteroid isomerase-like protein
MNERTSIESPQQEVLRAEQDWIDAYLQNDATRFDEYLTGDFLYTSPYGELVDRPTYLSNMVEGIIKMDFIRPADLLVRLAGDTAIVTALWNVQETYKGKMENGAYRILRVWVRQTGRWRAIAFQVTSLQPIPQ